MLEFLLEKGEPTVPRSTRRRLCSLMASSFIVADDDDDDDGCHAMALRGASRLASG